MPHHLDNSVVTTITDAIPGLIAYWDRDLCCRFANKAHAAWFGQSPEAIVGQSMRSLLGDRRVAFNEPYIREALAGKAQNFQSELTRADGTIGHTWINYIPHFDENGEVRGFFVLVNDVTPLREAERRVQESEARYRLLAENGTDMVFELDLGLVRRYVSPACREILGYEPDELLGVTPKDQIHPEDEERVARTFQGLLNGSSSQDSIVNRIRHRDGRWVWVEATLRTLRSATSGLPSGIIGSLRDISARKAVELELEEANRRLEALAGLDGLTGLANRRTFDEVLEREYRRARRDRRTLSVIMIDVDHFKAFNDHYGHPEGDHCLRLVSEAIRTSIRRPGDMATRYGGEEFAVILPNTSESAAADIADQIREAVLQLALPHEGAPGRRLTVSCGVAAADNFDGEPAVLIKHADRSLYRAKEDGRNSVVRASKLLTVVAGKFSATA